MNIFGTSSEQDWQYTDIRQYTNQPTAQGGGTERREFRYYKGLTERRSSQGIYNHLMPI